MPWEQKLWCAPLSHSSLVLRSACQRAKTVALLLDVGFISDLLREFFGGGTGSSRYRPPVSVGDVCRCGKGTIKVSWSQEHGDFLGCTRFRYDRTGCNYAWRRDGTRL